MSGAARTGPAPGPVLVLVDGSNVARCAAWRALHAGGSRGAGGSGGRRALDGDNPVDDVELRTRLVDALCSWAPVAGVEVHVVFDGAGPWRPGKVRASADVIVIGSGRAEGDDVLERRASNAHRDRRTYWLATSDRALQQVAGARAERVIDADDLVRELEQSRAANDQASALRATPGMPDSVTVDRPAPATSQLGADLDDDTRAKLERLRRGLDPG